METTKQHPATRIHPAQKSRSWKAVAAAAAVGSVLVLGSAPSAHGQSGLTVDWGLGVDVSLGSEEVPIEAGVQVQGIPVLESASLDLGSTVLGPDDIAGTSVEVSAGEVEAVAGVAVLPGESLVVTCADVQVGTAACGSEANLLELEPEPVAGTNALALLGGLSGNYVAGVCAEVTLGSPSACTASSSPSVPGGGGGGNPGGGGGGGGQPVFGGPISQQPSGGLGSTGGNAGAGPLQQAIGDTSALGDQATGARTGSGSLAFTGATVGGLAAGGALLTATGWLLTRVRRARPLRLVAGD